MALENPFKKKASGPDWEKMSREQLIEIEKQTLRDEINDLRAAADDLEKDLDKKAELRAEQDADGSGRAPYSFRYKYGPWSK